MIQTGLFGIKYSNRDFTAKSSWGKNQFNSSFPAALTAFLYSKGMDCKYLLLNKALKIEHQLLNVADFFGKQPTSEDIFYAFETPFTPYQRLIIGTLPRVDLVIQCRKTGKCLTPIEIKLTALPDHTTCDLTEDKYGSELVVRPDTIVYLACSIAQKLRKNTKQLKTIFGDKYSNIKDWADMEYIYPIVKYMIKDIDTICQMIKEEQSPLILQPIWKTIGKSSRLAENCLDVFVWSDLAFTRLFIDTANKELATNKIRITRQVRTAIWLFKMLYDFARNGQINYKLIIDSLSYNTKNDKAFAISGKITHKYMQSTELNQPRIQKQAIKKIIIGGGQDLLSPERRFDAIIFNSPELFD